MSEPKAKPIIFSGEMVKAILAGRKSQTRRVLKPQTLKVNRVGVQWSDGATTFNGEGLPCAPGDMLWVREVWGMGLSDHGDCPRYKATLDYKCGDKIKSPHEGPFKWRSPIHMPRRFSRLTLEVTAVKVERLNEISHDDAVAEGVGIYPHSMSAQKRFREIWDSIHGPGSWDANPWVCAISFRRIEQEPDNG